MTLWQVLQRQPELNLLDARPLGELTDEASSSYAVIHSRYLRQLLALAEKASLQRLKVEEG